MSKRGRRKTTPNVIRAKARKELRKAERQAALKREADELGIPIHELERIKWEEIQKFRREPRIPSFMTRRFITRRERERDWW